MIRRPFAVVRLSLPVSALFLGLVALPAQAQQQDPGAGRDPGFAPVAAAQAFVAANGPGWHVHAEPDREMAPALVFGGSRQMVDAQSLSGGALDQAFVAAARQVVDELAPAFGFGTPELQLDRVRHLDLGLARTSDKVVVKFRQVANGVAVDGGWVNVLFGADGRLLAVDNTGLPHVGRIALAPENSQAAAAATAAAAFQARTGLVPARIDFDDYLIVAERPDPRKTAVVAVPAYVFTLEAASDRFSATLPARRSIAVAATGALRVVRDTNLVHQADLTGSTSGWGQNGLLPDGSGVDVLEPMKDVRLVPTGLPTGYSADDGSFTLPGASGATSVTASLNGQWARVENVSGPNLSQTLSVTPGVPAAFAFNAGKTEQDTAQVNAYVRVEQFRDWVRAIDPAETAFDFQVLANVNLNSTCNAYYDGVSLNFYLAGGGCVNTAYASVVWHEEGHWANDLFGSGNGSDGFGEGAADCWSMYIADDPIVGPDFSGSGSYIRSGLNTTPFCGDNNIGCYGEVHADGEPLMGAIWKVRDELEQAATSSVGKEISNRLLLSWFQVFNDSQIKSIIEEHWLVLDDDDGNIDNGTPHFAPIDAGFKAQGFPGYVPALFNISHVPLTIVHTESPVMVTADVVPVNAAVSSVLLHHSSDGGQTYGTVAMTNLGGDTWGGMLPGVVSPKVVRYYIEAVATGGAGSNFLPKKAPSDAFVYDVGTLTVHESFDFEPVSDEGWTHVLLATQDDWQHDVPQGKSTDPAAAYSGSRVWGNDLGPSGYNGIYQPNVDNKLISPTFDLSGKTNTRLRFRRWLGVEKGIYDQASVQVNGTQVFVNPPNEDLIDTTWVYQDFDIHALADNNPSVQLTFELVSDPGVEFGGWNIDDLQIVSLGPVTAGAISQYGTGTPGQGGVTPVLSGSGTVAVGGAIGIDVTNGRPLAPGALFVGGSQASVPAFGGTFLVGGPFVDIGLTLGAGGSISLGGTLPNDPGISGVSVFMQAWFVDPAGPKGKSGTNGLTFTVP